MQGDDFAADARFALDDKRFFLEGNGILLYIVNRFPGESLLLLSAGERSFAGDDNIFNTFNAGEFLAADGVAFVRLCRFLRISAVLFCVFENDDHFAAGDEHFRIIDEDIAEESRLVVGNVNVHGVGVDGCGGVAAFSSVALCCAEEGDLRICGNLRGEEQNGGEEEGFFHFFSVD